MVPELEAIPAVVRRESAFALTLGAGLFGATAGTLVFGPGLTPFALLVVLGVVGWLASNPTGAPTRLALWCGLASALGLGPARGLDVAGLVAALPFVGPTTLALFALALTLFASLRPLAAAGSHEDGALARLAASRWLLLVGALCSFAAALLADAALGLAAALVLLFAAVRWALGRRKRSSLRRWLDGARDEASPRWRVVDRSAIDPLVVARLRPLVRAAPLDGVLVCGAPAGPYRGEGSAIALAPRSRPHDTAAPWALPWRDVGYALALIVAVGTPAPAMLVALAVVLAYTPLEVVASPRDTGFIALGFVITLATVGLASSLATDRRRVVWKVGLVAVGVTAAAILALLA